MAKCTADPHNPDVQTSAELNPEEEQREQASPDQSLASEESPSPSVESQLTNSPSQLVRHRDFEFPGVLGFVPEYRDKLMEFITQQPMDEGDQIDILVALQEALANAALHGCKDDPAKKIVCAVTADAVQILVSVRDPGPGFHLERADPERFEASRLSRGRGIALMRGLMSEVSFTHKGAEIILRKRLTPLPH